LLASFNNGAREQAVNEHLQQQGATKLSHELEVTRKSVTSSTWGSSGLLLGSAAGKFRNILKCKMVGSTFSSKQWRAKIQGALNSRSAA
jgi:hypothetical protein